jgi:hypothetical protein
MRSKSNFSVAPSARCADRLASLAAQPVRHARHADKITGLPRSRSNVANSRFGFGSSAAPTDEGRIEHDTIRESAEAAGVFGVPSLVRGRTFLGA